MGALGMISVFDVEEIGEEALQAELEMDDVLSAKVVEAAGLKAKEVAEQQERDREAEEARRQEDEAAASVLLDGSTGTEEDPDAESRAADILGGGGPATPAATDASGDGIEQSVGTESTDASENAEEPSAG